MTNSEKVIYINKAIENAIKLYSKVNIGEPNALIIPYWAVEELKEYYNKTTFVKDAKNVEWKYRGLKLIPTLDYDRQMKIEVMKIAELKL